VAVHRRLRSEDKESLVDRSTHNWIANIVCTKKAVLEEEATAKLAISIRKYPTCELVDAYLEQLRELLQCQHDEETLWVARVEASRAFEEANPGSSTFLSRTSQRTFDRIRGDLAKAESKYQSMFDKAQEPAGTRTNQDSKVTE
jgi:hypothetical protein